MLCFECFLCHLCVITDGGFLVILSGDEGGCFAGVAEMVRETGGEHE